MVLYETESQDQSVDIFIKMGKSNVSPTIPQHHWNVYVRFEFCNDSFLKYQFSRICFLHSLFKKCHVPNICTVSFVLTIYGFHTSGSSYFMK